VARALVLEEGRLPGGGAGERETLKKQTLRLHES
jgi:hypothetical protein